MVLSYQKAELLKNTRRKFYEVKSSVDNIKSTVVVTLYLSKLNG